MKHQKKPKAEKPAEKSRLGKVIDLLRLLADYGLFFMGPVFALFTVEMLNERNPLTNLNFREVWMNLVLYAIVWLGFWLIFGRRRRASTAAILFFFVAGLVNHYVLKFKGVILFPNDLVSWKTAANVMGTYDFSPDHYIIRGVQVLCIYLAAYYILAKKQEKRSYLRPVWLNLVPIVAAAAYIYMFFFSNWLIDAKIRTQQWNTQNNGWVLNFSLALRYSRVERPKAYSLNKVRDEISGLEKVSEVTLLDDILFSTPFDASTEDEGQSIAPILTVKNDPSGIQPVNILCIMDESFADMSIFDQLETNTDVMPFYHSLTENTVKGWLYSPITGGGTANAEFEFLTGCSLSFLPPSTMAYQLYVKENMPSLISWANALGFDTTTFHPYKSSGWNRVKVYNNFGADRQIFEDDLEGEHHRIRKFISDTADFDVLKSITSAEEGDRQFIFNVTMQNHGSYKQKWKNLPREIELEGKFAKRLAKREGDDLTAQYLNLMHQTDLVLKDLLEYYSTVEEPTMIVFFGDHQARLANSLYQILYGKKLDERDIADMEKQYVVPFFIWTNYDSYSAQDVMLSTNYLGALAAQMSNYPTTGYMDFLSGLYQDIPVINTVAFMSSDGTLVEQFSEFPEETKARMEEYRLLNYYNLFSRSRDEGIDKSFFLPVTE